MLATEPVLFRKIRVMLVDDSMILLREAIAFLQEHPAVEIVGSVYKSTDAVKGVQEILPDVVLVDVTVHGVYGLPLIRQLHAAAPELPVIVLDQVLFEGVRRDAFEQGAAAFVPKVSAKTHLLSAILSVAPPDALNAQSNFQA